MYLLRLFQLAALIAAASPALSLPTDAFRPLESFSGENGYYHVITADDGTHSATFTPMSALNMTVPEKRDIVSVEKAASPSLKERDNWGVACTGVELSATDLLGAQAGLRAAAGRDIYWITGHWAFVRYGSVIAYGCAYQGNPVDYYTVNTFELELDDVCHWPNAGWTYNVDKAHGLNIGRGPYGSEICASGFIGW